MKYKYNFENKKDKSKKKRIIFCILALLIAIICSSFLFAGSENKIISNISNAVIKPFRWISNSFITLGNNIKSNFSNSKKLSSENEELKVKIYDLEYQILEQQKILNENISLKKMLDIKSEYQHFNLKFGKIILREHDNWSKVFTINIGSNDGIKLNQAVVSTNGLVGYISKVHDNTSVVTTILDPTTSVSVNIGTINEPAILKGNATLKASNRLKLEYIQIDTTISLGDMLYTSGLGNTYPSTIPVGKIVEVKGSKNDMDRYAIVEPTVNISAIEEVAIIID